MKDSNIICITTDIGGGFSTPVYKSQIKKLEKEKINLTLKSALFDAERFLLDYYGEQIQTKTDEELKLLNIKINKPKGLKALFGKIPTINSIYTNARDYIEKNSHYGDKIMVVLEFNVIKFKYEEDVQKIKLHKKISDF